MSRFIAGKSLNGMIISVNHPNYGVLFAAMIKGSGTLVSETDESGIDIPFLTTQQILTQLEKFGFLIQYDVKTNLPDTVISYLSSIYNLGFDRLNIIYVPIKNKGTVKYKKSIIAINTADCDPQLLIYAKQIDKSLYNLSLDKNYIINVTDAVETDWSWLTYSANIADILEENIDDRDEFKTITDVDTPCNCVSYGEYVDNNDLTPYDSVEVDNS